MESLLALSVGFLFAIGVYLALQGHLIKFVIAFSILSNAANLLIFSSGRMTRANPPVIPYDVEEIATPFANPLPEALILTAIVIGFGFLAFTAALAYRYHRETGALDTGEEDA